MRRVRSVRTPNHVLLRPREWFLFVFFKSLPGKALVAALAMIALFTLLTADAPILAHTTAFTPEHCAATECITADPLGWQPYSITRPLPLSGISIVDQANEVRFYFPRFSALPSHSVQYNAFVSDGFYVGQRITSDNGEIIGLYTLDLMPPEPGPTSNEQGVAGNAPGQSGFLLDWTMRLNYAGCVTPVGCEFAKYDEASLRCYWFNPEASSWDLTERRINLDENRLTCISNTTGLHAIVARRADTSGETEAPPVYIPIVWGPSE